MRKPPAGEPGQERVLPLFVLAVMLLSALFWAVSNVLIKRLGPVDPLAVNGWVALASAPLLFACEQIGIAPEHALYVGDDLRDVQAARAAGMPVVAAGYGYIGQSEVNSWQADAIIERPQDLLTLLVA